MNIDLFFNKYKDLKKENVTVCDNEEHFKYNEYSFDNYDIGGRDKLIYEYSIMMLFLIYYLKNLLIQLIQLIILMNYHYLQKKET